MSKRLILVLIMFLFFSGFRLAGAEVSINEVKISPIEDRFIRLYNSGGSAVDLTGWYIQRKTAGGASFGSLVSKTYFENKNIGANAYFLISRNEGSSDILVEGLTLTESNTLQLKNSEGVVVDKVCWGDVSDCGDAASPNPSPGESIKFREGDSVPATSLGEELDQNSVMDDESADTEPKTKTTEKNPTIKAKILASKTAFTGEPLEIKAEIFGFDEEKIVLGRLSWNFGDGGSLLQTNNFEEFTHTYYYPGEYVLYLEYYKRKSVVPDAINKMTIKVIPTSVIISKVGDAKDFFIELSNNAPSDMDISGWIINANGKIFTLPKNTIIMAKKQMTIPGRITGFTYGDQSNLKLFSGVGEMVFDYSGMRQVAESTARTSSPANALSAATDAPIYPKNLSASSVNSIGLPDAGNNNSSWMIPFILALLVGSGAAGVYYIRRQKAAGAVEAGSDYEILDE